MAFGGAQGMNTVMKNNRNLLGKRKKMHERNESISKGAYRKMEDHKAMNTHEYAAFQKEQFRKRKLEKRKNFWIKVSVVVLTISVVVFFLYFWNHSNFENLKAPFYQ